MLLARQPDGDAFRIIMQRHIQRLHPIARAVNLMLKMAHCDAASFIRTARRADRARDPIC
jgi:hypothetical protein